MVELIVITVDEWFFDLFVPGHVAQQGSKKAFAIKAGPKGDQHYTGKVTLQEMGVHLPAWRKTVNDACAEAWGRRAPLDGPLYLHVEFVRPRPKSAPKRTTPPATTTPDLSKYVRAIEDSITTAGVWVDDARVTTTYSHKRLAEIDETPGARIRIGRVSSVAEKSIGGAAA